MWKKEQRVGQWMYDPKTQVHENFTVSFQVLYLPGVPRCV